jgi:HSP20 family protein
MMLTLERWTPSRELEGMERRMRRLFETVGMLPTVAPPTDIYETDKEFVVELEVPGFDEKELAVEVSDHSLIVRGEHKQEAETSEREHLLHERLERRFMRRFELPADSDSEQVSATCEKGLLTLRVPKAMPTAARKVEITT